MCSSGYHQTKIKGVSSMDFAQPLCSYSKSSTEAKYMDDPNSGIIIGGLGLRV
jgi:hypothetical protein